MGSPPAAYAERMFPITTPLELAPSIWVGGTESVLKRPAAATGPG